MAIFGQAPEIMEPQLSPYVASGRHLMRGLLRSTALGQDNERSSRVQGQALSLKISALYGSWSCFIDAHALQERPAKPLQAVIAENYRPT
jgi:hypothetical protein